MGNLIGSIFCNYLVVGRLSVTGAKETKWLGLCLGCGKKRILTTHTIKTKLTPCCCSKTLVGAKYGRLTVLSSSTKGNKTHWHCKCSCGNSLVARSEDIRVGKTTSCGCYAKEVSRDKFKKLAKIQKGKNHPSYKHSLTEEDRQNNRKRNSREVVRWRKQILKFHKNNCLICGNVGKKVEAHHIHSYTAYPTYRFKLSNGAALCSDCHADFHKQYGYGNNNRIQWGHFLKERGIVPRKEPWARKLIGKDVEMKDKYGDPIETSGVFRLNEIDYDTKLYVVSFGDAEFGIHFDRVGYIGEARSTSLES